MTEKEKADIKRYLAVVKRATSFIEQILDNQDGGLLEEMMVAPQPIQPQPIQPQPIQPQPAQPISVGSDHSQEVSPVDQEPTEEFIRARQKHIKDLMEIDCWPEAVDSEITREPSEDDQIHRARSVVDALIDRPLEGLDVLDFGCGEGWITSEFNSRGAQTSGYDIHGSDNWGRFHSSIKFTTIWDEIPKEEFDIVMLYDVLDHAEDPELVMRQVRESLSPDGIVYVRCHPWLSRHGSHVYNKGLNKSHIHLFLTYEELATEIGEDPMFVRTEIEPEVAYKWWFNDFKIIREDYISNPISDFFKNKAFKDLLRSEHNLSKSQVDKTLERMEVNFVDFQLTK